MWMKNKWRGKEFFKIGKVNSFGAKKIAYFMQTGKYRQFFISA
jgi:hypothetical protein